MDIQWLSDQKGSCSPNPLWHQFKAGSSEAYALIYQQHFFYLLDYGKKICADRELVKDSLQDLFVELWNRRAGLSDTSSVRFYLANALRYQLYKKMKKPLPRHGVSDDAVVLPREEYQIQEEATKARQKKVQWSLQQLLTTRQREVVHLKFYRELDNDEIAAHMQISKAAVYNTLSKAMKVLRENLNKAALALLLALISW